MPHIKRPFEKDGIRCYKCGKPVERGSYNWSYNTHLRGAFAHATCTAVQTPQPKPQPQEAPVDINQYCKPPAPIPAPAIQTAVTISRPADITDRISLHEKHNETAWIRTILRNRKYPFLYGSPGAGKTHLALSLAQDMGIMSLVILCSSDMLRSEILGSKSPLNHVYSPSKFRTLWENGGLVLFDECGLASATFLNLLNSAMEQRVIDFPDGEQVPMHPDFFMMFADNSTLRGTDPLFPERQDCGGAFRDRLTYVEFEYDLEIEIRVITMRFKGDADRAKNWHETVLTLRKELQSLNVPIFASSRFAYASALWQMEGAPMKKIVKGELLCGISEDVIEVARPTIERILKVRI